MRLLPELLENNRQWAASVTASDPDFFTNLAQQQKPEYLWIGCSDSRVPANQVVGVAPGEVFVHRNIANVVVHSDFNCLSVIEFAVAVLQVKHIIVCGHYGCGGVKAASQNHHLGLIDNWLRHIRDVRQKYEPMLLAIDDEAARLDRLCELNVIEQVHNVCHTSIVQESWEKGQSLAVHGWIYGIQDGLIHDLDVTISGQRGSRTRFASPRISHNNVMQFGVTRLEKPNVKNRFVRAVPTYPRYCPPKPDRSSQRESS